MKMNMGPRLLYTLLLCFTGLAVQAQIYTLTGRITDPQRQPLGFASIYIKNTTYGTTANANGRYTFNLRAGTYQVVFRSVGYKQVIKQVKIDQQPEVRDIQMVADSFMLSVAPTKSHRDIAAKNIIQKVIAKRRYYRDEAKDYSCAVYLKGVQRLVSAPKSLVGDNVAKVLDLDSSRRGILYQTEILARYNYQYPNKSKEVTLASKLVGQNAAFNYNKASDLQANFYKNWFRISGLTSRGFISPVASFAPFFYNYKLLGAIKQDDKKIYKIQVMPKRTHDPTFRGTIYIIEGDWRIYSTDLLITPQANINMVDTLQITQQYIPVKDSLWMPGSIIYNFKGNVFGFHFDGYYTGIYNNYNLNPNFPKGYFNGEVMQVDTQANSRDSAYWDTHRPMPLTAPERIDYHRKDSMITQRKSLPYLDSVEHSDNQVDPYNFTVTGYTFSNRKSGESFYIYPFYEAINYNPVEGYSVDARVKYTKTYKDGRTYSITPDLRYGFANKLFSANVNASYTFAPQQEGQIYGGFGSDILDLSNVGTRSLIFNTISTLLYENNYVKLYRSRYGRLGFQHDLINGVLWNIETEYATRDQLYNISGNHIRDLPDKEHTANNPFTPNAESFLFPHHNALTFKTSLLITFDRKYETRPTGRVYEPAVYPQLRLNYRKGIKALGSNVDYDFVSADIFDDYVSLGLLGFSSYQLTLGSFFNRNKLYYVDYNHFLGNEGMVFDPTMGNFHYLPFYTYSASSRFIEAHYEHNFAGNIFNLVPLLRKLKLEEVVGGNYLTESGKNNYYEFYFGIKRLFFRLDFGFAYDGNHKINQGFKIFYGIK